MQSSSKLPKAEPKSADLIYIDRPQGSAIAPAPQPLPQLAQQTLRRPRLRMFSLRHSILIHAPIDRVFALSTSVAIVERELGMNPVEGRLQGLVTAGDTIRWEGIQLGFANYHVSRIVPETWNPPHFFQDRMIAGRFNSFQHDHHLTETANGTLLEDQVRFTMPLAWPGWLVGRVILVPHICGLLRRRFDLLKHLAESDEWRQYLSA